MVFLADGGSLMQGLVEWDQNLFKILNSELTNPVFDKVFPYLRNSVFWAPLYIFILVFMTLNFGKKGWWWSVGFILTVAVIDMTGFRIKLLVDRNRPCFDPDMIEHVRLLLKQCSGSSSFVSNHAANHFGIATFAFLTFRGILKGWMYLGFAWAFFIAYAQVYVGVHYPLDVVGGAMLGIIVGILTSWAFNRKWGSFKLDQQLA